MKKYSNKYEYKIVSNITSNKITNWGYWGIDEYCGLGKYAIGFKTKLQNICNNCDNTGLNGISLLCGDNQVIKSSVSEWGEWDNSFTNCLSNEKLIGFKIKVQAYIGSGDDTATNAIKMICSNNIILSSLEGPLGDWNLGEILCPNNTFICGLKTQTEPPNADNTALNNVLFHCCN